MSIEPLERTNFAGVIDQELKEIEQRRQFRKARQAEGDTGAEADGKQGTSPMGADSSGDDGKKPSWQESCHQKKLFGVCISGGGIRSATFALGVLQGLTAKGLLQKADYLSTVSGGGYIGSWIQGILKRPADPANPYKPLKKDVPKPASEDPITFLRKYSNYLAPRRGFSVDTLLIPMIWSRNMILNQVIIITAFLAAFLLGFWPGVAFLSLENERTVGAFWFFAAAFVLGGIAVLFMARHLNRIAIRSVPEPEPATETIAEFASRAPGKITEEWGAWKIFDYPAGKGSKYVTWFLVIPVFLAVVLLMCAIYSGSRPGTFSEVFAFWPDFIKLGLLSILFVLLQAYGGFYRCFIRQRTDVGKPVKPGEAKFHIGWMSLVCAAFTWFLLKSVTWLFWHWYPSELWSQVAIAYAPPIVVLALMAGIVLQIGLMGKDFPDASREWLARAGTLFWMGCAIWIGYFSIAVFAPYAISRAYFLHYGGRSLVSVITAWLGSTAASVLAGKSAKTAGSAANGNPSMEGGSSKGAGQNASPSLDKIARYGPIIAIGGFLLALAFLAQWLLHTADDARCGCTLGIPSMKVMANDYWAPFHAGPNGCWYWSLGLLVGSGVIFTVLSWRVDINEFSMHHFYKNRLVRCYLGASATSGVGENERRPDWFTGFDPKDDIPLKKLRFDPMTPSDAPYPIVNATVNVTVGTELATQERKGLSWIFTPWYSGFYPSRSEEDRTLRLVGESSEKIAEIKERARKLKNSAMADKKLVKAAQKAEGHANKIREAEKQARDQGLTYALSDKLGTGVALGTAMAVSGAAANPNWGSHSSAQTAFLLTLFNVRLGWWMGNPADENKFKNPGPGIALFSLFNELSGKLDEGSGYLNLSDGGHFENLGMYELIRRRCRYVIAIDGEADPEYRFEGLGGAVRKCRNDFGVDIVINPRPIQLKSGMNKAHCVVGRIRYPEQEYPNDYPWKENLQKEEDDRPGWLLYIKSSVTGDEPADVEEYRREHPDFPQQSTIEQFFTESQFESYRMLGLHVASTVLDRYEPKKSEFLRDKKDGQTEGVPGEDQLLQKLFAHLAARWEAPPLAPEGVFSRHAEAYSNLMTRLADHPELTSLDSEIVQDFPTKAKEQHDREAVFFWLELIQLAENIFVDLNLGDEQVWKHPAYAGWRRVFKYWASRQALQDVWRVKQVDGTITGQAENYGKAFADFFDDLIEKNPAKSNSAKP
jgi:hypothetical protein